MLYNTLSELPAAVKIIYPNTDKRYFLRHLIVQVLCRIDYSCIAIDQMSADFMLD